MRELVDELVRVSLGGCVIGAAPLEDSAVGRVFDARTLLASVVQVPALYATGVAADEAGARWRYW